MRFFVYPKLTAVTAENVTKEGYNHEKKHKIVITAGRAGYHLSG